MDFEKLDEVARKLMIERKAHLEREVGSVYYHGARVSRLVLRLREMIVPGDDSMDDILRLAAMFHDVAKGIEPHQRFGPPLFREAVRGLAEPEEIDRAAELIAAHCDRRPEEPVHGTWARLLQDADLLDHLGTYSVWMDINYNAHKGLGVDEMCQFEREHYESYRTHHYKTLNFDISKRYFNDKLDFLKRFNERMAVEARGELYPIDGDA